MVQSCLGPLPVFKVYKIAPEIPPTLTVDDLDRQSETVTPSSLNANFDTIPSSKKHDRPTAKLRARVLSTHTGVVLPEHYELIAGGVGDGVKPLLNRTDFGRLSTEIFSERFGKSSFLVQWATGESATEEFIVSIRLTCCTDTDMSVVGQTKLVNRAAVSLDSTFRT